MAFDDAAWVLNKLSALIGAGVSGVKSVQRGTHSFIGSPPSNVTITFNQEINPDKAVVILKDSIAGFANGGSTNDATAYASYLVSLNAGNMVIAPNYVYRGTATPMRGTVSWQLIEFY